MQALNAAAPSASTKTRPAGRGSDRCNRIGCGDSHFDPWTVKNMRDEEAHEIATPIRATCASARSDTRAVRATAFLSPAGDRLTVVTLNTGNADATVRLDAGGFLSTRAASSRRARRAV